MTEPRDERDSDEPGSVQAQLRELQARCDRLEAESVNRTRLLYLSVIALYAVFGTLLVLHWAGHVTRHS